MIDFESGAIALAAVDLTGVNNEIARRQRLAAEAAAAVVTGEARLAAIRERIRVKNGSAPDGYAAAEAILAGVEVRTAAADREDLEAEQAAIFEGLRVLRQRHASAEEAVRTAKRRAREVVGEAGDTMLESFSDEIYEVGERLREIYAAVTGISRATKAPHLGELARRLRVPLYELGAAHFISPGAVALPAGALAVLEAGQHAMAEIGTSAAATVEFPRAEVADDFRAGLRAGHAAASATR